MEDESNNLPSLIPPTIEIPTPIPLRHEDTLSNVLEADVSLFNTRLQILHSMWSKATSFGKALRLLDEMTKTIELRRKIMRIPFGASETNRPKEFTIQPID